MPCSASAPAPGTPQQSFFSFDSVRFSVQGSNLKIVSGRPGKSWRDNRRHAVLFSAVVTGVIYVRIDETTYMVGQRD